MSWLGNIIMALLNKQKIQIALSGFLLNLLVRLSTKTGLTIDPAVADHVADWVLNTTWGLLGAHTATDMVGILKNGDELPPPPMPPIG